MATLAHSASAASRSPVGSIGPVDLQAVEAGVPLAALEYFLQTAGLELKDIYDVIIAPRTLTHRRARKQSLSRDESDKFARVVRIYEHTVRIFGSREKSLRFLRLPKERLENRSPLQMLSTDLGGRMVEDMLWGLADGVFV